MPLTWRLGLENQLTERNGQKGLWDSTEKTFYPVKEIDFEVPVSEIPEDSRSGLNFSLWIKGKIDQAVAVQVPGMPFVFLFDGPRVLQKFDEEKKPLDVLTVKAKLVGGPSSNIFPE